MELCRGGGGCKPRRGDIFVVEDEIDHKLRQERNMPPRRDLEFWRAGFLQRSAPDGAGRHCAESYTSKLKIVTVAAIPCLLEKWNWRGNGGLTKIRIGH